ncbi:MULTISPECIES: restriction endonuclease [Haloarcula]|uniref:restriction endonuclease n=1 Tax=Haloarcula TaxID=2237 RepID=UPI0023E87E24|nr:restriction endonuclease [Halomicroarcula sp. SHR3]
MDITDEEILKKLQGIDEYEFEALVAELWEKQGWNTTVTSGSNDRGVDVIAEKNTPFYQKQLIQAKRYSPDSKVGSPDIQQYSSLRHQMDNVDSVVVVTTSDFTLQAQEAAKNLNVKIIDGKQFISLINKLDAESIIQNYTETQTNDKSKEYFPRSPNRNNKKDILNQSIRLSKQNSGTPVYVMVYLDGAKSGYAIAPQFPNGAYNVHMFINEANTIGNFDRQDWENIVSVADKNDFKLVDINEQNREKIFVGRDSGKPPEADEMLHVMRQFLPEIFSISPQYVDLVIKDD